MVMIRNPEEIPQRLAQEKNLLVKRKLVFLNLVANYQMGIGRPHRPSALDFPQDTNGSRIGMRREMMASSLPQGEGEGLLSLRGRIWMAFESCYKRRISGQPKR